MIAAFGGGGGDEEEEGASKAKPKSSEEIFCEIAAEIESRMPQPVDLLAVERSYPVRSARRCEVADPVSQLQ